MSAGREVPIHAIAIEEKDSELIARLRELADRCDAATGPDRELDTVIRATLDGYTAVEERKGGWIVAVGKGVMEQSLGLIDPGKHSRNFTPQHHDTPTYTASLDAALTLVPEGWSIGLGDLRGYDPIIWRAHLRDHNDPDASKRQWREGHAPTAALALCAAALRARAQEEERK